jgi:nucleoside-diphosphate-sugar epimerase
LIDRRSQLALNFGDQKDGGPHNEHPVSSRPRQRAVKMLRRLGDQLGARGAAAALSAAPPARAAAAAAASTSAAAAATEEPPRLVVFGGNGFVGSRVCEAAAARGASVASVSRSGRPAALANAGAWADGVRWERGDALDPARPWADLLRGAAGVVSTLGAFGSNEQMYRVCGAANIALMEAAAAAGVPRFAFISVHDYAGLPAGWHAQDFLLKGYFQGKRDAERKLAELFPAGGVALRPGFVYGKRLTPGGAAIPLGLLGAPLAAALALLPTRRLARAPIVGAAFVPPVAVEALGRAAAAAALDADVPPGPLSVWDIKRRFG